MVNKALKIIRENKGLSQREFAKNIVSPSFYSKVESGQSQISASLLFKILEEANVTVQEFYYIKKNYKNEKQVATLRDIRIHFSKGDIAALEVLYKKMKETSSDENILLVIENLKKHIKNVPFNQSSLKVLEKHLLDIPGWGHYEFQLFSLCSYFFDADTLILLSNNVVRNIEKYKEFVNYEQDFLIILINLVKSLVKENNIEYAHYYLQLAKSHQQNPLFVYERLLISFFDFVLSLEVNPIRNEKEAHYIIGVFKSLDMINIANHLEAILLEQLSKQYYKHEV